MSASSNPDSVSGQGEFASKVPRSEPMTTSGHAPGVLVGNDAAPEFHAQTLPAGTAPADRTFKPDPINETPGQALNDDTMRSHGKESTYTSAESTLGGATSGDVHSGLGQPTGEKDNVSTGLVGRGASGAPSGNQMVDERVTPNQRGLERESDELAGKKFGSDIDGANERPNVTAEEVATERD
ncbi:hypothetical protein MMC19_003831 [Ptychographa xylographoides]|nr:hypothetical protein [Ptychographa xylographoides]